jgi:import receptor subunit TOM20
MEASNLRLSSIFAIGTGTLVTGFLAYAIYFDHRRRNDPNFRKALKRESKLAAKAEQQKKEAENQQQQIAIREAVERVNAELPPNDDQEREAYFMDNIQAGEDYTKKGK